MSPPRYRTLDGDEIELPLAMGRRVLVPRALARFDPELAWALDYDDAPEPEDADPRLDFSAGALLVPVQCWNEHAVLEPNLAPCDPPDEELSDGSAHLIGPPGARDGEPRALMSSLARAAMFPSVLVVMLLRLNERTGHGSRAHAAG